MTDGERIPAGWYPDPLGHPQLRWWDNHAWTEHVSDAQEPVESAEIISVTARAITTDAPAAESTIAELEAAPVATAELEDERLEGERTEPEPEPEPEPELAPESRAALLDLAAATPLLPDGSAPTATDAAFAGLVANFDAAAELAAAPDALRTATATLEREDWSSLLAALVERRAVTVDLAGLPQLAIDAATGVYWWPLDHDSLPERPAGIAIAVADVALSLDSARPLEPLVWRLAHLADADAAWAEHDGRTRLRRWPNLTSLPHTPEQVRMTSMLSHAALTVDELAGLSGASTEAAARLVGAFRILGIAMPDEDVPAVPPARVVRGGLFERLRARLARTA